MDVVEKVARAMCAFNEIDPDGCVGETAVPNWLAYSKFAETVIAALDAARGESADERQAAIVAALRGSAEDLGDAGYNHWLASDEMHKSDCRATGEHTALHAADWIESGEWRRA